MQTNFQILIYFAETRFRELCKDSFKPVVEVVQLSNVVQLFLASYSLNNVLKFMNLDNICIKNLNFDPKSFDTSSEISVMSIKIRTLASNDKIYQNKIVRSNFKICILPSM